MQTRRQFIKTSAMAVVAIAVPSSVFTLFSCDSEKNANSSNPFDNISDSNNDKRNKIVVISDLHLGADIAYTETIHHLDRLEQFLKEVRSSTTIKEMIINGDLYDDWYVPTRVDTYGTGSHADFIRKTIATNQKVFDQINGIIQDGKIKVTYIPGNHDLGFTAKDSDVGMPGVNQARDSAEKYGIGKYSPDGYPQILLEHGHRYDFFNALVPNAESKGYSYPPGYFYGRIAANSFTNPTTPEEATPVPIVTLNNATASAEDRSKFVYYKIWEGVLKSLIYVKDNFDEKIYKTTNVGNFTEDYAMNDILPHNTTPDGGLQINLYNDLFTQKNWEARLRYNNADVMTGIDSAIYGSLHTEFIDEQSNTQYFQNPNYSNVRIVLFGHTHQPMIKNYTNLNGKPCIYANSGTWVDKKTRNKNENIDQDAINMNFLMLYPTSSDSNRMQISLYQYKYGEHLLVSNQEINL